MAIFISKYRYPVIIHLVLRIVAMSLMDLSGEKNIVFNKEKNETLTVAAISMYRLAILQMKCNRWPLWTPTPKDIHYVCIILNYLLYNKQ